MASLPLSEIVPFACMLIPEILLTALVVRVGNGAAASSAEQLTRKIVKKKRQTNFKNFMKYSRAN
ncbi:MAG: hypothetical protein RL699_1797 [Bacteroidota bacterium]